jgi:hypothetical protein
MKKLRALWRGELALAEAFWTWAVAIALVVNFITSALFVAMMVNGRMWEALVLGYGLSVPYNLIAIVGVWRSAARYDGPAFHAHLARGAIVVLMVVLTLT